jgi:hypothetical protein
MRENGEDNLFYSTQEEWKMISESPENDMAQLIKMMGVDWILDNLRNTEIEDYIIRNDPDFLARYCTKQSQKETI